MGFKTKVDEADRLFSQYIRQRDKKCLRCGRAGAGENGISGLQASHFQGRRKENIRYDTDNVCSLCAECHFYFTAHPGEHYQWQVNRLGQEKVNEIILRSNLYKKKDRKLEVIYWQQRLADQKSV